MGGVGEEDGSSWFCEWGINGGWVYIYGGVGGKKGFEKEGWRGLGNEFSGRGIRNGVDWNEGVGHGDVM